jgi:hypothetical protein
MGSDLGDSSSDPDLPVFDEAFVSAGAHEPSAVDRAARAFRADDLAAARAEVSRHGRRRRSGHLHRRVRDWRSWAPALVVLAILGGFAWMNRPTAENGYRGGLIILSDDAARPTPQAATSDVPLGTPSPAPLSDSYAFMATQPDGVTPVAYDPCREIHVVINARTVPDGAERVVHEALEEMTAITGLQFAVDGEVNEVPVLQRQP